LEAPANFPSFLLLASLYSSLHLIGGWTHIRQTEAKIQDPMAVYPLFEIGHFKKNLLLF
jgi:hypothetical protein